MKKKSLPKKGWGGFISSVQNAGHSDAPPPQQGTGPSLSQDYSNTNVGRNFNKVNSSPSAQAAGGPVKKNLSKNAAGGAVPPATFKKGKSVKEAAGGAIPPAKFKAGCRVKKKK